MLPLSEKLQVTAEGNCKGRGDGWPRKHGSSFHSDRIKWPVRLYQEQFIGLFFVMMLSSATTQTKDHTDKDMLARCYTASNCRFDVPLANLWLFFSSIISLMLSYMHWNWNVTLDGMSISKTMVSAVISHLAVLLLLQFISSMQVKQHPSTNAKKADRFCGSRGKMVTVERLIARLKK